MKLDTDYGVITHTLTIGEQDRLDLCSILRKFNSDYAQSIQITSSIQLGIDLLKTLEAGSE